jgi:hypothetical protein
MSVASSSIQPDAVRRADVDNHPIALAKVLPQRRLAARGALAVADRIGQRGGTTVAGPTSAWRRRVRGQELLERLMARVLAAASPAPVEHLPADRGWLEG